MQAPCAHSDRSTTTAFRRMCFATLVMFAQHAHLHTRLTRSKLPSSPHLKQHRRATPHPMGCADHTHRRIRMTHHLRNDAHTRHASHVAIDGASLRGSGSAAARAGVSGHQRRLPAHAPGLEPPAAQLAAKRAHPPKCSVCWQGCACR